MSLFEPIFEALNRQRVRYVVVGGVAVVLHGHVRLTGDLDLVIDLSPDEARKAIETLVGIGLRPTVPVEASAFADPATRAMWGAEKGMKVFSMANPADPVLGVDLFVENPIDFDELWARSEVIRLKSTEVRIASIEDLITMKEQAGRLQDLADIEALEQIRRESSRSE